MDHLAAEKHERGRAVIVAVDEAHLLSADQLEELRLLTNSEMDSVAPFTGLLLGQPTLRRRIKLGSFAALDQRIALRYTLPGMTDTETRDYLTHHLKLVGRSDQLFSDDAADLIHHTSRGLPRAVNNLALQALVATYAGEQNNRRRIRRPRRRHRSHHRIAHPWRHREHHTANTHHQGPAPNHGTGPSPSPNIRTNNDANILIQRGAQQVWAAPGRNSETLDNLFRALGTERAAQFRRTVKWRTGCEGRISTTCVTDVTRVADGTAEGTPRFAVGCRLPR